MVNVKALQATNTNYDSFERTVIARRDPHPDDVVIKIQYCGICHSDIMHVDDAFHSTHFPVVPGHEITGVVTHVGPEVTGINPGDRVGIGCFVDSCGECEFCRAGMEQFCTKGVVTVFDRVDYDGQVTAGGYSEKIVVKDHFVVKIPDAMNLAEAAPMMCAGITTYRPLKKWHVSAGKHVAIIGLGGLGHIAVQFAHAMGAEVVVLGHSANKANEAARFGADEYKITANPAVFDELAGQFDFIMNTTAIKLDMDQYLRLLKINGVLVNVGMPADALEFHTMSLFGGEKMITSSNVGGIAEIQEMLDFAAQHNVKPGIEMISVDDVPTAYKRIMASDVHYCFVIDMRSLQSGGTADEY